ncbi:MAG TPA: amidase, partial [Bacteroidota bacterium]
ACLYNALGYPAGVVPATRVRKGEEEARRDARDLIEKAAKRVEQESAGLPVGVQVVARPWMDHTALAVMHLLQEKLRGRPDYPATPVHFAGVTGGR